MAVTWKATKLSDIAIAIDVELETMEDEFTCLLQSDAHWDHPRCDRKLYYKHLDQALESNIPVVRFGDLFCAMQMPGDKRMTKGMTRPEHDKEDYATRLTKTCAEDHIKYRDIIVAEGLGNHETGFLQHTSVNLIDEFCEKMRARGGIVEAMGYNYWVFFRFTINQTKRVTKLLYGFHGKRGGGGAEVTKGTLGPSRWSGPLPDADIVVYGHIHEQWTFPVTRWRISRSGDEWLDEQLHLQLPSYKTGDVTNKRFGWAKERGFKPQPVGACWLDFSPVTLNRGDRKSIDIKYVERRAK